MTDPAREPLRCSITSRVRLEAEWDQQAAELARLRALVRELRQQMFRPDPPGTLRAETDEQEAVREARKRADWDAATNAMLSEIPAAED